MRRLFLGGLGLALGCLLAQAQAEEIQWRPANSRTGHPAAVSAPAQTVGKTGPRASATAFSPAANSVQPVVFSPAASSDHAFIVRAKNAQDPLQPLPMGPAVDGPLPPPNLSGVEIAPPAAGAPPDMAAGPPVVGGPPGSAAYDATVFGSPVPGCASCGNVVEPDWSGSAGGCGCGHGCFGNNCCRLPRIYASGEYLLWWVQGMNTPPLVTATTIDPGLIKNLTGSGVRPGALGQLGTVPVYGGDNLSYPVFSGGRFTLGYGFANSPWGVESAFFFLGKTGRHFAAASQGQPGLYRPYLNVSNPAAPFENGQVVAFPTLIAGGVTVDSSLQLWGIEGNARRAILCNCNHRLDFLGGFRYLNLNEQLTIRETPTALDTFTLGNQTINKGDQFIVVDSFGTRNNFYGGQFGVDWEWRFGRAYLGVTGKLAMGVMHEEVTINGSTAFIPAATGVPVTAPGGLLALPSNIGSYSRNQFAVIPEVGVKIGYQITNHLSAYMGYNFLYVSNVVRPGDQIDRAVNTSQIPILRGGAGGLGGGPARPAFVFRGSDFWAQGLMWGLEYRY